MRQNPPQASLDQARMLEAYLRPMAIGILYALLATVCFVFAALFFGVLVYGALLTPTLGTDATFLLIALCPAALALLCLRYRPDDPVSTVIRSLADSRRQPVPLDSCPIAFKVFLKTGEVLCVNLWFYFPRKCGILAERERLISYTRGALEAVCALHAEVPDDQLIEEATDRALQPLASHYGLPVFYAKVRDMHKIRDAYSKVDDLTPSEYLGTGTLGLVGR